jgi:hypothetical protein
MLYEDVIALSLIQGDPFLQTADYEAVGKRPSAALPSSLVTAAYFYVRLIPRDFGSLAYGHFPPASKKPVFRQSL